MADLKTILIGDLQAIKTWFASPQTVANQATKTGLEMTKTTVKNIATAVAEVPATALKGALEPFGGGLLLLAVGAVVVLILLWAVRK